MEKIVSFVLIQSSSAQENKLILWGKELAKILENFSKQASFG